MSKKKTLEEFVEEANKVHDFLYDYSNIEFEKRKKEIYIRIICKKHNLTFWQKQSHHLHGIGCSVCGIEKTSL